MSCRRLSWLLALVVACLGAATLPAGAAANADITGTVTAVTGGGDVPLQGATATADNGGMDVDSDVTGVGGQYALSVPAGAYTISFEEGGHVPTSRRVTVSDGQSVTLNVRMTTLAIAGDLQGTVTDAGTGAPISAASVTLLDTAAFVVATDSTDPSGDYGFSDLTPDNYTAQFSAAGYAPVSHGVAVAPLQAVTTLDVALSPPDTRAPETSITRGPNGRIERRRVRFGFRADEPGADFECKLDRRGFAPCTSPKRYRVTPGRHRFQVRAIDMADNVDLTPAKRRFRVAG